jgi:hypothetical protein
LSERWVGAYFGQPALGYTIGSMIGGYVDPVRNFGPRLTDAQQQTSQDGIPIPILFGCARFSGNVIASGPLVEHKHSDDGKGSGQVTTTYTYSRTYAIGICEGPIEGIRRIWRNGKVVYDARVPDGTDVTVEEVQAVSGKFNNMCTIYKGDETQTPNSDLQSLYDADTVPAFRGLAYIVVHSDDLTALQGAVPQYEFEVVSLGTTQTFGGFRIPQYGNLPFGQNPQGEVFPIQPDVFYRFAPYNFNDPSESHREWFDVLGDAVTRAAEITGLPGGSLDSRVEGWGYNVGNSQQTGYIGDLFPYYNDGTNRHDATVIMLAYRRVSSDDFNDVVYTGIEYNLQCPLFESDPKWGAKLRDNADPDAADWGSGVLKFPYDSEATHYIPLYCELGGELTQQLGIYGDFLIIMQALPSCVRTIQDGWLLIPDSPDYAVDPLGNIHNISDCTVVTGDFTQLRAQILDNSVNHNVIQYALGPVLLTADPGNTEAFWTEQYNAAVLLGYMPAGLVFGVDYPDHATVSCECSSVPQITPAPISLALIVANLCSRAGLPPDFYDVSNLEGDIVAGFLVATDATAADTINALAPAYQFDGSEWDNKVRFVKRGGAEVASITLDQAVGDGSDARIIETRVQEVELPRKLTLTYQDPAANYAPTTQSAGRYAATVNVTGTATLQIPVVLTADEAARAADILLKDKWSSLRGTIEGTLADDWSILTPSDVVYIQAPDDAVFRVRLGELTSDTGAIKYTGTQDLRSSYTSDAVGMPVPPPQDTTEQLIGPTLAYYLNLPALRDQDDQAGYYVAATGLLGGWRGALIQQSTDGGATFTSVVTINQQSTMGQTLEVLPAWNPWLLDDVTTIDVQISSGTLSSITQAQLFAGGNGCVIGQELLQFQTATYLGDRVYRLSGLIRGRKSTPYVEQPVGSGFALLDSLYFVPMSRSVAGRTLTMRASSLGTALADGVVSTFSVPRFRSITEWAPTNVRGQRDGSSNLAIAWSPRARLGNAANPYQSAYFNGYIISFTHAGVTKTYTTAAASFNYTAAQQTADFGAPQASIAYSLAATNSLSGAGDTNEGTI